MHALFLGYAIMIFMFIKKKKNRSRTTSVVVAEKQKGKYIEHITIGVSSFPSSINLLIEKGKEWILNENKRRQPEIDLFGEEMSKLQKEREGVPIFILYR